MIATVIGLTLIAVLGLVAVRPCLPPTGGRSDAVVLLVVLAVGLGAGAASCTLFFAGLVFDSLTGPARAVELIVLAVIAVGLSSAWRRQRPTLIEQHENGEAGRDPRWLRWSCLAALVAALTLGVGQFLAISAQMPHGEWDAWAIWNLRARFLALAENDWTRAFRVYEWGHPDYPLLVPLTTARFWAYLGDTPVAVPRLVSLASWLGLLGLLVSGLARLRGLTQACLAGTVFIATEAMLIQSTFQYADLTLAFYVLATIVLIALADRVDVPGGGPLLLAGATAALAAWTKNEGIVFLLATVAAYVAVATFRGAGRARRCAAEMAIGAIVVVPALAYFKLAIAPPNDIIAGQATGETLSRLSDGARHATILRVGWRHVTAFCGPLLWLLPLYALIVGVRVRELRRVGTRAAVLLTLLTAAAYYLSYAVSPNRLDWHVDNSASRLLAQLWPAVLFILFLVLESPGSGARHLVPRRRAAPPAHHS